MMAAMFKSLYGIRSDRPDQLRFASWAAVVNVVGRCSTIGVPPPDVVAPAAVVVVSPGWHGDRYCDGRRYWDRDEWEERHRHHGHGPDHCPPGHAKKGEC
jgi:hypothetical protein